MAIIDSIKERAKKNKKTIVLPESMDARTFEAAEKVTKEGIANIVIIATPEQVEKYGKDFDLTGVKIVDPFTDPNRQKYIDKFVELRAKKGMTPELAEKQMTEDYMYYACLMCKCDDADGAVSGACHSTANTIRPALQLIKTAPGAKLVSAFFLMDVPNCEYGANGAFIFADSGLNQDPTSEEMASIANDSAKSFRQLVQVEPKVAFISHSTKGSAKHALVDKVVNAVKIAHEEYPELACDGELQVDAAIVPSVAASKAPGSEVAGKANVLMFPNLDCGNSAYKLVQRLAKADAFGPVLQGIAKPVNDLSRGCSADDIVGVVAITSVQCGD